MKEKDGEQSFSQNFQYITIYLESIAKEFIEFCYVFYTFLHLLGM